MILKGHCGIKGTYYDIKGTYYDTKGTLWY